jgi:hypothetical protein
LASAFFSAALISGFASDYDRGYSTLAGEGTGYFVGDGICYFAGDAASGLAGDNSYFPTCCPSLGPAMFYLIASAFASAIF